MIKFKQDTTLQVIENFDEDTDTITSQVEETFKKGELVDADIYYTEKEGECCDIQYGDGSISLMVKRNSFEVEE